MTVAAIGSWAPGLYTASWNSTDLGIIEGFRTLRRKGHAEMINKTDKFADATLDGIYRGHDYFVMMTIKEWSANIVLALFPFESTPGLLANIGTLLSAKAKPLILTAVSGTPAATKGPAVITAGLAIIAQENDLDILLGPGQRDIPVLFQLLPYTEETQAPYTYKHFVPTTFAA